MYFTQDKNNNTFKYHNKKDVIKKAKELYDSGFTSVGVGKIKPNNKYIFTPLYYWI